MESRTTDLATAPAPEPGPGPGADWALHPATTADVEPIAELRALVMRPDLERLGRYDEHRVRQRLRDAFSPRHTSIITVGGDFAGCVALRPAEVAGEGAAEVAGEGVAGQWLEHFYLDPRHQGRGLGSAVLRTLLDRADEQHVTVHLNVLQGSAARRLYERHGFVVTAEDPIDVYMTRLPR
ncbi:GNAT family N-acetyltransferase [Actinacidiphila paucisporea]|nr:GNAT family N-acetyltransferase [Actinacidiphila paucisporea]